MPKLATLKIQQARNEPILANPEIQHFSRIIFSKNMFIFKAKEYQSEKSPIFDSQKSTKTTRKLHIMSQLYAAKVCQLFCNTRYIYTMVCFLHSCFLPLVCRAFELIFHVSYLISIQYLGDLSELRANHFQHLGTYIVTQPRN